MSHTLASRRFRAVLTLAGLGAAHAATAPAIAQSYPTIVGEWHDEKFPQDCGGPSAIHIGPRSYVDDGLSCTFDDVARKGSQVTWNGSCNDGNNSTAARLVATEADGRLTLRFNGSPGAAALRRCAGTGQEIAAGVPAKPVGFIFSPLTDARTAAIWHDFMPPTVPQSKVAPGIWTATSAGGVTVSVMRVAFWSCGTNTCSTRFVRDGKTVGQADLCDVVETWSIVGDKLVTCDKVIDLRQY